MKLILWLIILITLVSIVVGVGARPEGLEGTRSMYCLITPFFMVTFSAVAFIFIFKRKKEGTRK